MSQGDLFVGVTVGEVEHSEPILRCIRCIVLSHDCEIDKPQERARHALVAEVRSEEDAPGGLWNLIKQGKPWNTFYLEAGPNSAEGFVDFRRVYRIEKSELRLAEENGRRIASTSDDAREALVYAFTSFLLHEELSPAVE